MKLYNDPYAPSPRRVRFFAAEKGIPLELVPLSIAGGDTARPLFGAINPAHEVPVLELDDGRHLTESLAICRYLEALRPEPNLLGRDAFETAQIEQWVLRLMFRLYVPMTQVFRNTHPFWAERITQVPAYGELARTAVLGELAALESQLIGRDFIVADRFTLADIVACTTIDFGKPSKIRLTSDQPQLLRWHASIAARPAAKA